MVPDMDFNYKFKRNKMNFDISLQENWAGNEKDSIFITNQTCFQLKAMGASLEITE
jgi:hypothetical protein